MYDKDMDFLTHHERPSRRYILATMPRSGSTLCSIRFWQSGQLGAPLEYLNLRMAKGVLKRLGYVLENGRPNEAQMASYWTNLQKLRTSPNGVFGCKLFVCNLAYLSNRLPEFLSRVAPTHVVYLTRRDLVGQAISYSRAQRSNIWFGGLHSTQTPQYDFEHIRSCLTSICGQMAVWERLFKVWGIQPLRLYYEQICRTPRRAVVAAKAHMGLVHDPASKLALPLIVRQADRVSSDWRTQFLRDAERYEEHGREQTGVLQTATGAT
ncbi:MAG: Stf0 family sulfotransferase [Rhodanobacteraceae bacterium]